MNCSKCGAYIPTNAKKCIACDADISETPHSNSDIFISKLKDYTFEANKNENQITGVLILNDALDKPYQCKVRLKGIQFVENPNNKYKQRPAIFTVEVIQQ